MNPSSTNSSSSNAGKAGGAQVPLNPGDEAAPGTPDTGEDLCLECNGTGKLEGGKECPNCGGTGKVIRGIGGG